MKKKITIFAELSAQEDGWRTMVSLNDFEIDTEETTVRMLKFALIAEIQKNFSMAKIAKLYTTPESLGHLTHLTDGDQKEKSFAYQDEQLVVEIMQHAKLAAPIAYLGYSETVRIFGKDAMPNPLLIKNMTSYDIAFQELQAEEARQVEHNDKKQRQ